MLSGIVEMAPSDAPIAEGLTAALYDRANRTIDHETTGADASAGHPLVSLDQLPAPRADDLERRDVFLGARRLQFLRLPPKPAAEPLAEAAHGLSPRRRHVDSLLHHVVLRHQRRAVRALH